MGSESRSKGSASQPNLHAYEESQWSTIELFETNADGLLLRHLPEIFREETILRDFLGYYEDLLGALDARIGQLHLELDPATAPVEFLDWLSGWVGLELDRTLSPGGQRNLLKAALVKAGERGTESGLVASVAAALCIDPQDVKVRPRPGDTQEGDPNMFQVEIDISSRPSNGEMNKQNAIQKLQQQVFLIIDTVKPAHSACNQLTIYSHGQVVIRWPSM